MCILLLWCNLLQNLGRQARTHARTHPHTHTHTHTQSSRASQASARATRSSCSVQDDETYFPHAVVEICAALVQNVHIRQVWHLGAFCSTGQLQHDIQKFNTSNTWIWIPCSIFLYIFVFTSQIEIREGTREAFFLKRWGRWVLAGWPQHLGREDVGEYFGPAPASTCPRCDGSVHKLLRTMVTPIGPTVQTLGR